MDNGKFYNDLARYIKSRDTHKANSVIMREIAVRLLKDRPDFIEVLRNANISMPDNTTDSQLINAFVDNAPDNRKLLLGAAFLVGYKNQKIGADGRSELSDSGVKAVHKVMYDYFDASKYEDVSDTENEDYYDVSGEDFYNAGGFGDIVKGLTDVGGKLIDKNKAKKFGASETLSKQQDAKRDMIQSIMEQRKAKTAQIAKDQEAKAKTTKMLLIGGGVVLAVGLIIGVIYAVKKSKSKK